ncbi:hypothetical protein CPB83DRAFT_853664 [Crepidotus variabilis]|uniref:Rhodopsin domain-containing protein n=1 Tax=Crepidotus variabilis TaxID=179855 RepID=A0A9P6EGQ3_9AGAR|nr:hypothetical protein CPB83DRAFT_853664 [Crepidotus variabilis]
MAPQVAILPPFSVSIGCLVAAHGAAFITTLLRLLYRFLVSRLWWDDFWAFIALVADTMVWAVYASEPIRVLERPLAFQIFWKMSMIEGGSMAVWASRLSIGVTIVRLAPPGPFNRICKGAVYLFGLLYIVVAVEKIFCAGVHFNQIPLCIVPKYTNISVLITDVVSDIWLLGAPAYMMMKMKVSRRHRRLIIAIFSCEIFVTFSSIICAYFNLEEQPYLGGIAAHIQLGVSIVVCNLLVLVTYVYRIFTSSDESSRSTSSSTESPAGREKTRTLHFIGFGRTRQLSLQLTDLGSSFGPPSDRSNSPNPPMTATTSGQSPTSTAPDFQATRLTTTFDLTDFSSHLGSQEHSQILSAAEGNHSSRAS